MWFDIPFCDAEIMFGASQNIEIEFATDDVHSCPIKIFAIEVYAQSKKEFQYRDKIKKLDKLIEEKPNIDKTVNEIPNDE